MGDPHPKLHATRLTRTFGRAPHQVDALGPLELTVAAGLLRPTAGTLEIRTSPPSDPRLRRTAHPAAMIFQDYGIYDWKTVRANVRFGLDIQRVPRREADARGSSRPTKRRASRRGPRSRSPARSTAPCTRRRWATSRRNTEGRNPFGFRPSVFSSGDRI